MAQFTEDFENTLVYPPWRLEGPDYGTFSVSNDYAFEGSSSWKTTLPCQLYASNTYARNELTHYGGTFVGVDLLEQFDQLYSKKFAMYLPSDYVFDTSGWHMLFQYHAHNSSSRNQPSMPIYDKYGKVSLHNNYSELAYPSPSFDSAILTHPVTGSTNLATLVPGRWHCFQLEVYWDYTVGGNGYIRFYMALDDWPTSSDLIASWDGQTGFNDVGASNIGNYFKYGLYCFNWTDSAKVASSLAAGVPASGFTRYYDSYTHADVQLALNTNQTPTAIAGNNQSISVATTTLDGTQSYDSDGTIVSYLWEQVSGPNTANILTPSGSSSIVNGLIVGDYVFRLTVTDDDTLTDTDTVTITVNPVISTNKANARVLSF